MTRWPYAMKRKTAALYCDLAESTFIAEVDAGRLPQPINLGGRDHWLQPALERALAHLAGEGDTPDYRRELLERYG